MFASEGEYSPEINKLRRIEKFGMEAATGRKVLTYKEYTRLIYAENIMHAYESRKASSNWAEWSVSNPTYAAILADIEKIIND